MKLWVFILMVLFITSGWFVNLYKATQCDFESPWKCEVIRVVGVLVPPVGVIIGWIDIDGT